MRKTSLRNALCAITLIGITLFSAITSTVAANAAPTNNQSAAAYQQTNTQILGTKLPIGSAPAVTEAPVSRWMTG